MIKKVVALTLVLSISSLMLFGCGKEVEESVEETTEAVSAESVPDELQGLLTEEETEAVVTSAIDFSAYLTDEGRIEGIKDLSKVKVPDFSSWTFKKDELTPKKSEIEAQIEGIMAQNFGEEVKGTVEDGDTLSINYIGSLDGEVFDSAENQTVVAGSNQYVGGFLTKVIGHEVGETFDIQVVFPDSYPNNTALEGKETTFQVTINSATRANELTDDFVAKNLSKVQDFFGSDTIKTAQDVYDFLSDYYFKSNLNSAIFEKLSEEEVCDKAPDEAIKLSKNMFAVSIYTNYGKTVEEFTKAIGFTEEQIDERIASDAKQYLLLDAIAEEADIKVTDEMIAEMVGSTDISDYVSYYGRGYLAHSRMSDEIYAYIKSKIKIE